jgi:hypothetical protein
MLAEFSQIGQEPHEKLQQTTYTKSGDGDVVTAVSNFSCQPFYKTKQLITLDGSSYSKDMY